MNPPKPFLPTLPVLDHGFVTLRNLAGPTRRPINTALTNEKGVLIINPFDADDIDPANTARMSFDQMDSGRTREDDLALARYLMKNRHTSPFEMVVCWIEMKLPIFVARQFVRHRTTSINEVSGRYVKLPQEWYIPKLERVVIQSKDKKQGGKQIDLNDPDQVKKAKNFLERLNKNCQRCYRSYEQSISDEIAMEQARLDLHVNHYTHWIWKQDLHNMMHYLSLRDHSHAQSEATDYAEAITKLLRTYLPHSMALYDEFRRLSN